MSSPSFAERPTLGLVGWAFEYVIYRYGFHAPHPGAVSFFTAGVGTELYYISKAVGARR
jgi:hypothetical protein